MFSQHTKPVTEPGCEPLALKSACFSMEPYSSPKFNLLVPDLLPRMLEYGSH